MTKRLLSWLAHRLLHDTVRFIPGEDPRCADCGRKWMTSHLFGRKQMLAAAPEVTK